MNEHFISVLKNSSIIAIPRLDRDQRRHPAALAKSVQYQQGCFQGPPLGYRPGLTMWRRSGGHVLRKLQQKSGISIFSFGMIPRTLPEPLKIGKTGQRARSYLDRDPCRLLAFEMRCSATQEYPSLIDTFFVVHIVNGEFTRDEDRLIYEEMRRLEATGTYTDDEINRLARRGKQRGNILGVGRVLPARATTSPKFKSGGASGSGGCEDDEESVEDQKDEDGDGDMFEGLNAENPIIEEVATSNKAINLSTQEEGQSSTPLVERNNVFEKEMLEGKLVLVNYDEKPFEKVDYLGNTGSEDEVEPVNKEIASYSASKLMGVGYGTKGLLENGGKQNSN
ncbi:hypothetical protein Tco_1343579 [Tanacetum coccineum]